MIQRFSVDVEGKDKLQGVLDGLAALGFPDNAIRVWINEGSERISVHAYRDGNLDKMKRLDPDRMEDHCVRIWSRVGFAKITLTEFQDTAINVEYGDKEYFDWDSG